MNRAVVQASGAGMNSIAFISSKFGNRHNPVVVRLAVTPGMGRLKQALSGPRLIEEINESEWNTKFDRRSGFVVFHAVRFSNTEPPITS
jgi:hypothetical protein